MKRPPVIYSDLYEVDIGVHPFPTCKYRMIRDELMENPGYGPDEFLVPPQPSATDLLLVHSPAYVDDLEKSLATPRTIRSELPINPDVIGAFRLAAGGSLLAAGCAVREGLGIHLGGGLHHAFADHAEGFCYVNDTAIAARGVQRDRAIDRVLIVDADVHQGNGTASIFVGDDSVFTFSIHQENNYPVKERSDLDIGLADGVGDDEYVAHLEKHLPVLRERFRPDLVLYVAGADPYFDDQLGGLSLSLDGLRRRDRTVLETFVLCGIPVAVLLAGGYARKLTDTVGIHATTCREAIRTWAESEFS